MTQEQIGSPLVTIWVSLASYSGFMAESKSRYTIKFEADEKVSYEQRKGIEDALAECKVKINKILLH
jgi:hypothetical protein